MSIFPTKILLATDGSEGAELAATNALVLARQTGSELHLVHVLPLPLDTQDPSSFEPDVRRQLEGRTRARLEELVERIEASRGEIGGSRSRVGRPDAEIIDQAELIGAGLIVMGSRVRPDKASPHGKRLRLGGEARPLPRYGGTPKARMEPPST